MGDAPRTVLYLSPSVTLYGARVALLKLAGALDPARYRPVVACLQEGALPEALRAEGIETRIAAIRPWRKAKTWPWIPWTTRRLARMVIDEGVSLIHCNDFWAMPWARAARWWAGRETPLLCHVRNVVGAERVRKYHLDKGARLLVISDALQAEFSHWPEPMRREKVVTVHDGVDFDALDRQAGRNVRTDLGIPAGAPLLLQAGHLSRRKDQATLLDAMERLPETVHAILLGGIKEHDRDFARAVLDRAARPPLAGRVHWTDFQETVAPYYRACDVLCLPSRDEGLGLVSLEGMHFGKPVVASRVGGIPEVVADGETGRLHPPGDAARLAETLSHLLDDPALRERMGRAGRERAHRLFSLPAHARAVQEEYDRVLNS